MGEASAMKHRPTSFIRSTCALLVCATLPLACEEEKAPPAAPPAPPSAEPAAAAIEPKEEAKESEKQERPKSIPLELGERRSAVETAHPEAKGFLVAAEIEEVLKKDKKNSTKPAALKTFDKRAKGKWVLFAGTLVNPTDTGFDLAVTYTPLDPADRMGISRQFFTVTFSNIEGYKADGFKSGTQVAVVAKYNGAQAAGPGYELVADKTWQ
jgi:hypothetical protein